MKYPQPDFTRARQMHKAESQSYMNSYTASSTIGLSARLFNRITSCVLIVAGEKRFPVSDSDKKTNVGLNLKHLKQVCSSFVFLGSTFICFVINNRTKRFLATQKVQTTNGSTLKMPSMWCKPTMKSSRYSSN